MHQPLLTTSDCPVSAFVGKVAKKSAACATSSTVVNSPSTVSLSITFLTTSSSEIPAAALAQARYDIAESFRRAARYVDRILRSAKPGELPIEQPTRIHLAVNRKTAKALGLGIPQDLLVRADEVID
jgi:putative ABC transport system substrate-binding protein